MLRLSLRQLPRRHSWLRLRTGANPTSAETSLGAADTSVSWRGSRATKGMKTKDLPSGKSCAFEGVRATSLRNIVLLVLGLALPFVAHAQDPGAADLFRKRCGGCHAMDRDKTGPNLKGVYGRQAASGPSF